MKYELLQERDADREKIKILTEDNAQLQFEKKSNMNESTNLEHELVSARLKISGNFVVFFIFPLYTVLNVIGRNVGSFIADAQKIFMIIKTK